jgi:hypothetical protein
MICTSTIFTPKTQVVADAILQVVDDLKQYRPLTVRQIYYQLVSKLIIPNDIKQYRKVSRLLVTLRENELVPWHYIEDRSRRTTEKRGVENVSKWFEAQMESFANPKYYGRCYVQNQDVYVEVATEKDALSSIIEDVTWPFCTRLNVIRGQASATITEQIANRFIEKQAWGLMPVLLYLGDLDPSGVAIPKALQKNLYHRHGLDVDVKRIALNPGQVDLYALPSSPYAVKSKNPNFQAWLDVYGEFQPAVELDALHPEALSGILRIALENVYDMTGLAREVEIENRERELIRTIRNETQDFLHSRFPVVFREG